MSEHEIINNPVVLKLIGVITALSIAFLGYEHKQISKLRASISHVDDKREDNCMTKEQCVTNRDYQEKLLVEGLRRIEEQLKLLSDRTKQRRATDKDD